MASCLIRISGMPKLWMTSFEVRWTITGRSTGRWSWFTVTTSSAAAGSVLSRPSGLVPVSTRSARAAPKTPSAPG